MVELPNSDWIRSPKMPNYAVCLDRNNRFFGWKMTECNGNWTSVGKLTPEELVKAGRSHDFAAHLEQLSELMPTGA